MNACHTNPCHEWDLPVWRTRLCGDKRIKSGVKISRGQRREKGFLDTPNFAAKLVTKIGLLNHWFLNVGNVAFQKKICWLTSKQPSTTSLPSLTGFFLSFTSQYKKQTNKSTRHCGIQIFSERIHDSIRLPLAPVLRLKSCTARRLTWVKKSHGRRQKRSAVFSDSSGSLPQGQVRTKAGTSYIISIPDDILQQLSCCLLFFSMILRLNIYSSLWVCRVSCSKMLELLLFKSTYSWQQLASVHLCTNKSESLISGGYRESYIIVGPFMRILVVPRNFLWKKTISLPRFGRWITIRYPIPSVLIRI